MTKPIRLMQFIKERFIFGSLTSIKDKPIL